jgi:ribosomal protein S21
MKPGSRCDKQSFMLLLKEFRKKCGEAGISHDYKEHQFFESKSVKERKKLRNSINRLQQEMIEQKLLNGEKVRCSSKLIKKIRAKQAKATKRNKSGERDRERDGGYRRFN